MEARKSLAQFEIGQSAINAELNKDGVALLTSSGSKRVAEAKAYKETIFHLNCLLAAKEVELTTFTITPDFHATI